MGDDDVTNAWPKIVPDRKAFWPRGHKPCDAVKEKILSAFRNVKSFPLKRIIIQFWEPLEIIAGVRVLSCFDHPDMIISGAPPATAYLNLFPEVVLDLGLHRGTPLVDLALECELTCFMMIPVFSEAGCVGVVEVSMRIPGDLIVIFNDLKRELKVEVGLCICPPWRFVRPYKALSAGDLTLATSEIRKALQVAVQSHAITLAQVWMPYESRLCRMSRMLLGKLPCYWVVNPAGVHLSSIELFFHGFHCLPLKMGEGLVGRTLATRQPHLCRNIHKLSDNRGVLAVLSANFKCASFVICLTSSHTGEVNYLFEFFWPQTLDHLALMEALLLTLREHLPSFKYASGARLGDELLVVDVENSSSGSASTPLKIFPRNKSSAVGRKRTRASVVMKSESIEGQSELTNIINSEGDEDDDDLIIFAVYKVDYRLLFLPSSSTYDNFMEKIKQEFELNPAGTYKIKYQVLPGEWYSLTDGTCLKSCISSYRTSKNNDHVKLLVLAADD
ncbi:putative PB1 domain-containing protein [Helianthus annuus]|nr:putative PB1 domain-containing protein [Helianthus annuus]